MSKRVAILGAGPMGLAAAYELVNLGYEPVIFEADDILFRYLFMVAYSLGRRVCVYCNLVL